MPLITVITPTYNRAHLLPRLYDSLCRQTFTDFEWIVVDDGSTDDTQEVLAKLSADCNHKPQTSNLKPQTFKKENGGKHTAVNMGVKHAKGELVLILDSDDELPETSLADIAEEWQRVKDNGLIEKGDGEKPIGGLCGYMAHRNGEVISKPLVHTVCDEFKMWYYYHINHDMCEVFRTEVLLRNPFPEIRNERFCPEDLVWARIAKNYSLQIFPKVIYFRDYLDGGLTDNIVRIRMQSPIGAMTRYSESVTWPYASFFKKLRFALNYWRFYFCVTDKSEIKNRIGLRWLWAKPLGWLMHRHDEQMLRKNNGKL